MALSDLAERTRFAIYTHLADAGALPSRPALAELGITLDEYDRALSELTDTRNVVLRNGEVEWRTPSRPDHSGSRSSVHAPCGGAAARGTRSPYRTSSPTRPRCWSPRHVPPAVRRTHGR